MSRKLVPSEKIKLIRLYRSYALLWDINCKAYRRNDLKEQAYEAIGCEMGMSPAVVKKKIRALRSVYTSERRRLKESGADADDVHQSYIPWIEELSFLDGSIISRKGWKHSSDTNYDSQSAEDNSQDIDMDSNDEENNEALDEKLINIDNINNNDSNDYKNNQTNYGSNDYAAAAAEDDDDSEFTAFGTSIAHQLERLPEEDAYELMGEMQMLLTRRKLKHLKPNNEIHQQKTLPGSYESSNIHLEPGTIMQDLNEIKTEPAVQIKIMKSWK